MSLLTLPITNSYEILDTFNAGVLLLGSEVKSIKAKKGSLKGSFIKVDINEAWLVKATVPAFQEKNASSLYNPTRPRKLLLKKSELKKLFGALSGHGLTALPIELYNQNNRVYLKFALVRHKNKHDKREDIKKSEAKREIDRTLKNER